MTNLLRIVLAILALIGIFSGGNLSLTHFHTGDTCPELGPIPACYLVFLAYVGVFVSALVTQHLARRIFLIGWAPIFGLAFIGALLHTFVQETCPVDGNGVPQCYYSLGLSIILFILAWFAFFRNRKGAA